MHQFAIPGLMPMPTPNASCPVEVSDGAPFDLVLHTSLPQVDPPGICFKITDTGDKLWIEGGAERIFRRTVGNQVEHFVSINPNTEKIPDGSFVLHVLVGFEYFKTAVRVRRTPFNWRKPFRKSPKVR